ncbi:MAG: DUF1499 domain-containing protein [Parvularculaceae bacterium]|nr:DUF1499 domain-containing protein [Parvularculaceae bacterium]
MHRAIILVSIIALVLAAALAGLGPAYRADVIDLSQAFGVMRVLALPTLIAAGLAAIAFVGALLTARSHAGIALVADLAAGIAGYAPIKMRSLAEANPRIHDITTDFENPSAIVAAADLPRRNPPAYAGGDMVGETGKSVADSQRAAFPDIKPLIVGADVPGTAAKAREVLKSMRMEVLAESRPEDGGLVIEAVLTTLWFGFKDDFIVRLAPAEGGTRIDVRSKSRVGGSDLGANAARVRKFLAAMDAAL